VEASRRPHEEKLNKVTVTLPPVAVGHERQFCRCTECGRVYYGDFVPYSLMGRFLDVPCGHAIGHRDFITETQFLRTRIKEIGAEVRAWTASQLTAVATTDKHGSS
jgi:hypothetical protein